MTASARRLFRISSYLLAIIYFAASAWWLSGSNPKAKLLVGAYCLLLPAALLYLKSLTGQADGSPLRLGRSLLAASVLYLIIAVPLAWLGHPGMWVSDEASYIFQARTFLHGQFAAEAPGNVAAAGAYVKDYALGGMVIVDNRWFSKFTPGWPVLLAPGILLHMGWVWNVLIGLAFLWLAAKIAEVVYGADAAYWAPWIIVCPYVIFNCLGYMAHPSCAVAISAAIFYCIRASSTHSVRTYSAMIVCIAIAFLIRPFTAACAGGVIILFSAWNIRKNVSLVAKLTGVTAGILGVTVAGLIGYNWLVSGTFHITLYSLYKSIDSGAVNLSSNNIVKSIRYYTPREMLLTIAHAFPFVCLLAAYTLWVEKGRRWETNLLICAFASLVIGHLVVPGISNSLFGDRYYLEAYPALAVVGAQGLQTLGRRWSAGWLGGLMALLIVSQAPMFWVASDVELVSRRPGQELVRSVETRPEPGGVVFIHTMGWTKDTGEGTWRPAPEISWQAFNGPDWRSERWLILGDPGAGRRAAVACSVDRPFWMTMQYNIGALHVTEGEKAEPGTVCRP